MNLYVTLYTALLFLVLTPGVLLRIPKNGSKLLVAAVHGSVFAVVYYFTHKLVWAASVKMDGFKDSEGGSPSGKGSKGSGGSKGSESKMMAASDTPVSKKDDK